MNIQQRKNVIARLGLLLAELPESCQGKIEEAYIRNKWFTPDNIKLAISSWANALDENKIEKWLSKYQLTSGLEKSIAIIMAGNIPLVGLHDLICVIATGNKAIVKFSESDAVLMKLITDELREIEPELKNKIQICNERLPKDFDAVIATGSNNTNRYFDYYFRGKPHLLRKSRNSIAVLSGDEKKGDFEKLGEDIFSYFGFGCRNVSKMYVPKGFDLSKFFEGIEIFFPVIHHHKYANNYNYRKTIFLMNKVPFFDNNFLIVKEDKGIAAFPGVLNFEFYDSLGFVKNEISNRKEEIQCVVSEIGIPGSVRFGQSQFPELSDYADGVDTMKFLLEL
ncbi:MAG: acyl-CoA reductase [Bacteroidia bacterium]